MCCKWLLLVSFITVIVKLCYNFVLEKLSSLVGHVPSLQSWKNKGGGGWREDEWNGGWVSSANVDNLRISYLLSFFSRFLFTETFASCCLYFPSFFSTLLSNFCQSWRITRYPYLISFFFARSLNLWTLAGATFVNLV